MQQVNDDMDDLFRRAAESYPLKTDSADWGKVAAKIGDPPPVVTGNTKTVSRSANLLWLLLIPSLLVGYYLGKNDKINLAGNLASNFAFYPNNPPVKTVKPYQKIVGAGLATTPLQANSAPLRETPQSSKALTEKSNDQTPANKNLDVTIIHQPTNEQTNKRTNPQTSQTPQTNNPTTPQPHKLSRFYAGFFAGVDFSTIKYQEINDPGVQGGITIGYKINKHLSLETGLAFDKKRYYSEGEYFNTNEMNLPPQAKINSVSGQCWMTEVPLNVTWAITDNSKIKLSALAGTSSYFMNRENYTYIIQYNNGVPYPKEYYYSKRSTGLFAVANVGGVISKPLGKIAELRIEPYAKIPLKGVGIGKLPITSFGVNVGVTKSF